MKQLAILFACLPILLPLRSEAQSITSIEVDWEIIVNQPDSISQSPQISLVMAGTPTLNADYAEFRINPDDPNAQGGVKIDTWWAGGQILSTSHLAKPALNSGGDVIKLTTRLEAKGANTYYSVTSLSSSQWGTIPKTQLPSCYTQIIGKINFSIDLTLQESEVELGRNRVQKLVAKEVRYYASKRLLSRETTQRVLHQSGAEWTGSQLEDSIIDQKTAF